MNKKIAVVIRVYDRMADLDVCIQNIRNYWKLNDYYIIISSNGKSSGFTVSEETKVLADKVIELENNAGHLKGNSQLLKEGIKYIPNECEILTILEADTWIYDDSIINNYILKLYEKDIDWASAEWIERKYSLAVDIAVLKKKLLQEIPDIFDFTKSPEAYIANKLLENNKKFIYLKENMPVHISSFIRNFYNYYHGRLRVFPKAKMVTHHIEDLNGGIEEKKEIVNYCLGEKKYDISAKNIFLENLKIRFIIFLIKYLPKSSWYKKKKIQKEF